MSKLVFAAAIVCALSACSTATTTKEGEPAASDMPEYRTGSIIAKKKTAMSDGVKAMTAEQLEEVRNNQSIQR